MLRVALRVSRAQAEIVLAELLELVPAGVEEVDVDAATVEYGLYGHPGELPETTALRGLAGDALIGIDTSEVADDWAERWRDFHRPLVLRDRLSVRPPWEPPLGTDLELVIDPGRAFGTGAHATTRLCLEWLLDLDPLVEVSGSAAPARAPTRAAPRAGAPSAGRSVESAPARTIDLGCGSGVLAIAAAKLGHGPVLALDYDPQCLDATAENASVNGVELAGIRRFDLRAEPLPPARLVLANLLAPLLCHWAARMRAGDGGSRPEKVIASGLLVTEADEVSGAFAACGYRERGRRCAGEWAAVLLGPAD